MTSRVMKVDYAISTYHMAGVSRRQIQNGTIIFKNFKII